MERKHDPIRLTAGMGHISDFEILTEAGADEVFCGFVPLDWQKSFEAPLNRREVRYVHVQAGTFEDMRILHGMSERAGVPVTVTFNSLSYEKEQLSVIAGYMEALMEIGFREFIIADLGLMLYLKEKKIPARIHLSGEMGEWNPPMLRLIFSLFQDPEGPVIKRLIFHRKMSLTQMAACMTVIKEQDGVEAEAFLFNEMCHYTGGFCNSLHCDELVHMCMVPYRLTAIGGEEFSSEPMNKINPKCIYELIPEQGPEQSPDRGPELSPEFSHEHSPELSPLDNQEPAMEDQNDPDRAYPGESGCGLCALWQLREMGITFMKIVGRGKSAEAMEEDLSCVKKALHFLAGSKSEEEFTGKVRHLQKNVCGANCYYPNLHKG